MTTAVTTDHHGGDDARDLIRLMSWLSPSFPVGSFGYSHGLEQAIAEGRITDADSLLDWLAVLIEHGSGWNDAVLLAAAHRARGDPAAVHEVEALASALAGSAERLRESADQGAAFGAAARQWGQANGDPAPSLPPALYPVAVGLFTAEADLPLVKVAAAYLHAFAANLVTVALRAVPLGQSSGVQVMARLEPGMLSVARRAARSTLDDLGGCALLSDIMSMRHETLETRIFIT